MEKPKDSTESWLKFLHPETLKMNLILSSCFLAGYECLKDAIVDRLRSFYVNGFDQNGLKLSPEYNTEVLALDPKKNALKASITWLLNNQIIDVADCEAIERINLHRNELAHDLPQFLATAEREIQIHLFEEIMRLATKIERWWIINFELAINPDHDGREVDEDKIISGGMLFLQLLLGIATGVNSTDLYEKFKEAIEAKGEKTND
jgi:hypothetical protein